MTRAGDLREARAALIAGHKQVWAGLVEEVGWHPNPPHPGPDGPLRAWVYCQASASGGHLVEVHTEQAGDEWVLDPLLDQGDLAEHVATSLLGTGLACARAAALLPHLRHHAALAERTVAPTMTLARPFPAELAVPADNWSPNHDQWQPGGQGAAQQVRDLLASGRPKHVLGPGGAIRWSWPRPVPETAMRVAAGAVAGGYPEVVKLWEYGLHPELLTAIHTYLRLPGPLPSVLYAGLGLAHHDPLSGVMAHPIPITTVRDVTARMAGAPTAERVGMAVWLATAGSAADAADPQPLLIWPHAQVPERTTGHARLHAAGFTPADLARWVALRGGGDAGLVEWLAAHPPQRWDQIWSGPLEVALIREVAAQHQHVDDGWGAVHLPMDECLESLAQLLDTLDRDDESGMLELAGHVTFVHGAYSCKQQGECVAVRISAAVAEMYRQRAYPRVSPGWDRVLADIDALPGGSYRLDLNGQSHFPLVARIRAAMAYRRGELSEWPVQSPEPFAFYEPWSGRTNDDECHQDPDVACPTNGQFLHAIVESGASPPT